MDEKPTPPSPLPDWATSPPQGTSDVPPAGGLPPAPAMPPSPPPPQPPEEAQRPPIVKTVAKLLLGLFALSLLLFLATRLFLFIQEKRAPKVTTITYWGWEDKDVLSNVFSDFERENPDITIDYQKRDIRQYREALKVRFAKAQGPDIFRFHNSWYPMFKDELLPLPKAVLGENPEKDFYEVVSKDLRINGAYYGIPLGIDTLLLFVNTDLVKSDPPTTWNELRELVPSLTLKDGDGKIKVGGVGLGTFDNVNHAADIISLMFLQNGVDVGKMGNTPENVAGALTFYTSFASGDGRVWDETLDTSLLAFAKGNLALFFGYSSDVATIKNLNPNLAFAAKPVPQIAQDQKITLASYWVEGVSKKSKKQKAALRFLQYLTKRETLEKLAASQARVRSFGQAYGRVDLAPVIEDHPILSVVVGEAQHAASSPFVSDTFDNGLNTELTKHLASAVNAILSSTPPETSVEMLIREVEAVLTKYGAK